MKAHAVFILRLSLFNVSRLWCINSAVEKLKTRQSIFTKTWPENHPQTPPAELRCSLFYGIFNQHLHLAVSCTCVINKMRDLLSSSSQKQEIELLLQALLSHIIVRVCARACFCTCYTARTRIDISLEKWRHFWKDRTVWLFLNGCLRDRTWF